MNTPSIVTVRAARPEDEAFVVSLSGRFAETRPAWRDEREVTEGTAVQLRRAFAEPTEGAAILIAADAAGGAVGFAYAVLHDDFFTGELHGHLSEVAVAREGTGAGAALVRAVEEHFAALGVRFVTLNVNLANERAGRLYASLGFAPQVVQYVKVLR